MVNARGWIVALGELVLLLARALAAAFTSPPKRSLVIAQLYEVGVRSLSIVNLTAIFTGMVMSLQLGYFLTKFGAKIFVSRILGVAIISELGPVLTALMIGGRVGAGMAAELGTMKVSEQIDALRALGADPIAYLVVPRLIAIVVMLPLLTGMANLVGVLGGMVIARYELGFELSVHVLARDGAWTRVRGHVSDSSFNVAPYLPFDFEGWTDARVSEKSELGMIGIYNPSAVEPSHRAGSELELFAAPGRDARLLGKAARGAPFRSGRTREGYVAVKFKGVGGPNENSEFWVLETALSQQATRW